MHYPRATCRYADKICMHKRHAHYSHLAQAKDQSSWLSPQGDFPQSFFKVAEKPSPLGNKYKGQVGEPFPTCQEPWGMLHHISRLYIQVWMFPRTVSRNRLGKVMFIAAHFCRPGVTVPIIIYIVALMVLHGQFHSQIRSIYLLENNNVCYYLVNPRYYTRRMWCIVGRAWASCMVLYRQLNIHFQLSPSSQSAHNCECLHREWNYLVAEQCTCTRHKISIEMNI